METARSLLGACACNGKLYVIGGITRKDNGTDIAAVEAYDPKTNRWYPQPPLPVPCHGSSPVAVGNKIYVVGGCAMPWPHPIDFIQVYDTEIQSWTILETLLPHAECLSFAYGDAIICLGGADTYRGTDGELKFQIQAEKFMDKQLSAGDKPSKKAGKGARRSKWLARAKAAATVTTKGSAHTVRPASELTLHEKIHEKNRVEQHSAETWSYNTVTHTWTQLATAPKRHYPVNGYFYLDGDMVRAAEDNELK